MISIIIPIYNQASKVDDCLKSILSQSYADWEVILVNDGSTDDIESVVAHWKEKFPEGRFEYFSKENEGSNPTRNFGFDHSRGDYLLFCDADITMRDDMLEKMKEALDEHPDKSFAYCSFMYGRKLFRLFEYSEERLRKMPFIHASSLIRREHFPGFDNTIRRLQDWDVWLTMLNQGHTGIWIPETLFTVKTGGHISSWVPKAAYKLLPFLPAVKKYKEAMVHIKRKHSL